MIGGWKNKGLTSNSIRRQCSSLISPLSTAKRHWHQFAFNISRARCNMSSSSQSSGGSLMISEGGRCAKKPSRGRPRNGVHSLLMTPYLHSNPVCGATDCYSTCLTSCLEKSLVERWTFGEKDRLYFYRCQLFCQMTLRKTSRRQAFTRFLQILFLLIPNCSPSLILMGESIIFEIVYSAILLVRILKRVLSSPKLMQAPPSF